MREFSGKALVGPLAFDENLPVLWQGATDGLAEAGP